MSETVESLKKELDFYKKKLSLAEFDISVDGYVAFVEIVRQQVEHVKGFQIKNNIGGKKSEDATYERTEALWKNLPTMLTSVKSLKLELGIEYNPEEGKPKPKKTSPESLINRD